MIYFLLYNILLILVLPFYITYYLVLSVKNKEYFKLLIQNFSFLYPLSHFSDSSKKLIWLHASSVGEVQALKPLIVKLLNNADYNIAVSTMTITGHRQVKKTFKDSILAIYKPYDLKFFISLCLKKLKPQMLIIMETELWPNLIKQAHKKKIPLYLINARLSKRSVMYYKKILPIIKESLNCFTYIFTQSKKEEENFLTLGAKKEKLHNAGNIKYDICVPDDLKPISIKIKKELFHFSKKTTFNENTKTSPLIWLAASTHHNEEEILFKVQQRIQKLEPRALLILAPRHPKRILFIKKLCEKNNINFITRSSKKTCDNKTDVFILDSLGELIYFYQLAKIAFIGGSLVPVGGHNPLEAVAVNTPTVWGPYMFNFLEIKNLLLEKNKGQEVFDEKNLDSIILKALQKEEKDNTKLTPFLEAYSGAVDKIHSHISSQIHSQVNSHISSQINSPVNSHIHKK